MLNHFSKIIFVFFLCIALQNYAMETNFENNQQLSYNPEADSELLQIINTLSEQLATEKDWKNIIKCLENGADPNICDDIGYTPLHALLAQFPQNSQNFDPKMLETLLKYNANPNLPIIKKISNTQKIYSFLPLDGAIIHGSEDSVKILIKYGANINAKSSYIRSQPFFRCSITPLARAMIYNKLGILGVLCREYASLEYVSDVCGETAFEFAVKNLKNSEPTIKNLIVNARFKLPTTEKKLDLTALTFLLILKNPSKFQIPEDLKFRILAMLPEAHNWKEPDSKLYKGLYAKNYKNPYFFSRLEHHITNIVQILNKKNKLGKNSISLFAHHEKTKGIIPQLNKDVASLIKSNFSKKTSPDNLALQICNNYEELLEEEQAQNTK